MSWATVGEHRGPKGRPESPLPPIALPMGMSPAAAAVAWHEEWIRATDPAGRTGNTQHLAAFRTRHERLIAAEMTGIPAVPVTLPREIVAERPSHFAFVEREGRHLAVNERALLTRHARHNRLRRRHKKIA